jgi:hypothetical protein
MLRFSSKYRNHKMSLIQVCRNLFLKIVVSSHLQNCSSFCTHDRKTFYPPCPLPVLRIRDVYPGSEFLPYRIQGQKDSGSRIRIRIKEFRYFNPKIVSEVAKILSGLFIPDPDPDFYLSQTPDPGVKKAPDFGFGSATSPTA